MAAAYIEEIHATSEYTVTKYTQAQTSNRWRKFRISSGRLRLGKVLNLFIVCFLYHILLHIYTILVRFIF